MLPSFYSLSHSHRRLWIRAVDIQAHCGYAQGIRDYPTAAFIRLGPIGLSQGRMGVSSRGRGCGSTFFFELPLYRPGGNNFLPVRRKPRSRNSETRNRNRGDSPERVLRRVSTSPSSERPSDLPLIQYGHIARELHLPLKKK